MLPRPIEIRGWRLFERARCAKGKVRRVNVAQVQESGEGGAETKSERSKKILKNINICEVSFSLTAAKNVFGIEL